jgi:hypothetical protein
MPISPGGAPVNAYLDADHTRVEPAAKGRAAELGVSVSRLQVDGEGGHLIDAR